MTGSRIYGHGPATSVLDPGEFAWYCDTCGEGMQGVSRDGRAVEADSVAHDKSPEHLAEAAYTD